MEERYYLVVVKVTSNGSEERNLTPYDDYNTALRKFHEAFNVIGGGPKYIAVTILEKSMFSEVKCEVWREAVEPEPVEE